MRLLLACTLLFTALTPNAVQKSQPMTNSTSSISSQEVQSLKDDIHTLETSLQRSRSHQDWWNGWYLKLGVAALVLATFLGIASWVCQKKASAIEYSSRPDADALVAQNARLREVLDQNAQLEIAKAQKDAFDASVRAGRAETGAGEANERAAKAQSSLALAEQHSAEANAKAEGFRADIATANASAAQAEAQVADAHRAAAEANRIAESERLARLQLEARLADRIITPDQQARLTQAFSPLRGQTVDVVMTGDSPEISRIANAIIGCLQRAGIPFNFFHPLSGGGGAQGVVIGVRADAPEIDKQAGKQLVAILSETLGGGVGSADFDKVMVSGTGTMGGTPGATPVGTSALRLQIAPK
jgi:hypothetical protein